MNQLTQESLTAQLSLTGLPAPTAFAAEAQAAPAKSVQQVSQPSAGNNKKTELFLIAVVVAAVAVVGFVVRACAGVLVKCIGKGERIRGEGDLVPKTIFLVDAENTSATNSDLWYEVQVATTIAIEDLPTPPLPDAYARIEPSVLGKVYSPLPNYAQTPQDAESVNNLTGTSFLLGKELLGEKNSSKIDRFEERKIEPPTQTPARTRTGVQTSRTPSHTLLNPPPLRPEGMRPIRASFPNAWPQLSGGEEKGVLPGTPLEPLEEGWGGRSESGGN